MAISVSRRLGVQCVHRAHSEAAFSNQAFSFTNSILHAGRLVAEPLEKGQAHVLLHPVPKFQYAENLLLRCKGKKISSPPRSYCMLCWVTRKFGVLRGQWRFWVCKDIADFFLPWGYALPVPGCGKGRLEDWELKIIIKKIISTWEQSKNYCYGKLNNFLYAYPIKKEICGGRNVLPRTFWSSSQVFPYCFISVGFLIFVLT